LTKSDKHGIIKQGDIMPKRYKINEEQVAEIEAARKENKDKNIDKRLEALLLHAEGKKRAEIAGKTNFAISYISELVSKYCNLGLPSVAGNNYKGNRRNLSFAEEAEFLDSFKEKAAKGQVVTAKEMRQEYEKLIEHKCGNGQIYRILKRHNCGKLKSRGQHPKKASDEVINTSKKLTQKSANLDVKIN
jgi:transposase